jgi:hypothetical protein
MATTTNYSWSTPDDTALVKDGAAAIRSLGTAIDTTVFNNAGAAIAKTIVDAKGDIIAATAADTVARLAVGTNGQALLANSATATGLEWATPASGGMTLLSTTTLSGATTTISSINQTYKSLVGYIFGANISGNDNPMIKPNATNNTNTSYVYNGVVGVESDNWYISTGNATLTASNTNNAFTFQIDNYASSTNYKPVEYYAIFPAAGTGNIRSGFGAGGFKSNTAITSLDIVNLGGATFSAGTLLLYGVS